MAFEGLADRLQSTIKKITGKGKVSEQDVKEMTREVRLALLEADVNFKVVKDLIKRIRERAVGQEVMESLTPGQQVIKVVKEELTDLMGKEQSKIAVKIGRASCRERVEKSGEEVCETEKIRD